ncbi:hypothetical protein VPH35_114106 [Triticum aestivum]
MGYSENIVVDGVEAETFFAGQTGLGYDLENEKHVLVLVTYEEKNLATREYKLKCELRYVNDEDCYSLDPPRPVADVPPTYVNGKIFWLVEPNLGPLSLDCEIIAFDVKTEQFEVLQGPPCGSQASGHMSILQLNGALSVSCSAPGNNAIDIWTMKDIGTWLIEYHIDLDEFSPEYLAEKTTPLVVDPTGGHILLNTGRSLGYYDPVTKTMESIYSDVDRAGDNSKFCPIICHESFVSTLGSFHE